jgi:hypothetical protein
MHNERVHMLDQVPNKIGEIMSFYEKKPTKILTSYFKYIRYFLFAHCKTRY